MKQIDIMEIATASSLSWVELEMHCNEEDKLFFNGYQTWTTSAEISPSDAFNMPSKFIQTIGRPWGTDRYGDYFFEDYSGEPGMFHGYTYFYKRSGDTYTLIGSTDETNGYTIFYYNANTGRLSIVKDAGWGADVDKSWHLCMFEGSEDEVFDAWFKASGIKCRPAKPLAGYSSWYNRFDKINETFIMEDLEGCSTVMKPGDLFQIDDGWQTEVGDWLEHDIKFPRGLKAAADDIHEKGFLAGLWLAPFVASKRSEVYRKHPDWFLWQDGKRWYCGCNWGGFCSLDIDNPEVQDYLKKVFDKVLNEWGFDLVKLDFLYGAAPWGTRSGEFRGESRGARMCRAMKMLREWCDDKLILGCGVPLGPAMGVVDYCRIGCDASLDWDNNWLLRKVNREVVSTKNAIANSYFRRQLSGRAFLNDPDVFFLRTVNIKLNEEQKDMLAHVCAQYGDFFLTSDNMGIYTDEQRRKYAELLEIWRNKTWTDLDFLKVLN